MRDIVERDRAAVVLVKAERAAAEGKNELARALLRDMSALVYTGHAAHRASNVRELMRRRDGLPQ